MGGVIDKIIARAVNWRPQFKHHSRNNGKQMMCLLQYFATSCGITESVYSKRFDSRNKLRRVIMEGHVVSFPSRGLTKRNQIN